MSLQGTRCDALIIRAVADAMNLPIHIPDLSATPWDTAFTYDDIDDVWAHWSNLYNSTVEKHAPTIKKTVRENQLPWINVQLKKAIRLRNKLYRKFRHSHTDEAWENYRVQRNLVSKLKRIAIKRFCSDSAANATTPGGFWRRLKPLLPSAGKDNSSESMCLMDDGKLIKELSNLFNTYFSTPVLDQTILARTPDDYMTHPSVTSILSRNHNLDFSFQPVSTELIGTLLNKIKSNKSCGPDNIMPKILKLSAPSLKVPLAKLLNVCIRSSTWPTDWKSSNITPKMTR